MLSLCQHLQSAFRNPLRRTNATYSETTSSFTSHFTPSRIHLRFSHCCQRCCHALWLGQPSHCFTWIAEYHPLRWRIYTSETLVSRQYMDRSTSRRHPTTHGLGSLYKLTRSFQRPSRSMGTSDHPFRMAVPTFQQFKLDNPK